MFFRTFAPMKSYLLIIISCACLLCACNPKSKRPTYGELKAQRIDSMIKAAEREIPMLDKELQQACHRYDSLSAIVENHRQALKLTEQELNEHAALRLHRDSLQVKFDTQCARVRFLHRKLDEVNTKASDRKKAAESPKTAK